LTAAHLVNRIKVGDVEIENPTATAGFTEC